MDDSFEMPLFAKTTEERQQAGFRAIFEEAERLKNDGNRKFNNRDYVTAIDCYDIALEIIRQFSTDDKSEKKQRDGFLYKIYSNKAECFLRIDDPDSVFETFREAFWQNVPMTDNAKLVFRFAKGLLLRREYSDALNAVEVALQIEPNHFEIMEMKDEILKSLAAEEVKNHNMWKKIGTTLFRQQDPQMAKTGAAALLSTTSSVCSYSEPTKSLLKEFSAQSALSRLFGNKLKF